MNVTHQELAAAVRRARDQAREVLNELQGRGHPDTEQSSSLYLALVTLQKRLLTVDPPPPPIDRFVPDLQQLSLACGGRLASIKPLVDEALRLARGQ